MKEMKERRKKRKGRERKEEKIEIEQGRAKWTEEGSVFMEWRQD